MVNEQPPSPSEFLVFKDIISGFQGDILPHFFK